MEEIRAFIAVPLPDSLLKRLSGIQRRMEEQVPPRSIRWVRPTGIHLTLKFLGDTPAKKLPVIEEALAAVARHAPACDFTVGRLGCFPNIRRPRVIWVGVQEPTGRLAALRDAIEEALGPLGFPPEGRGFTPHLTLGRLRRRTSRQDVTQVCQVIQSTEVKTLAELSADRFALIRSILKPTGAEYTTLQEFELQG